MVSRFNEKRSRFESTALPFLLQMPGRDERFNYGMRRAWGTVAHQLSENLDGRQYAVLPVVGSQYFQRFNGAGWARHVAQKRRLGRTTIVAEQSLRRARCLRRPSIFPTIRGYLVEARCSWNFSRMILVAGDKFNGESAATPVSHSSRTASSPANGFPEASAKKT